jgi:hypothetical protein
MASLDLDTIGELLAELSPPPVDWIEAAVALPFAMSDLENLADVVRAQPGRLAQTERLEAALRDAGITPDGAGLAALRAHLPR